MPGILIGLKNIYYATLIADPVSGTATYTNPKKLAGAISASINPNPNKATLFGDDGPMEVASTIGQIEVQLNVGDIALEDQAILLGHTIANGVIVKKAGDIAPWVAIGFESLKSNGKRKFVWMTKGKFQELEQKHDTKGDSINFQTPTIIGSFVRRDSDDIWQYSADEDAITYTPAVGNGWYTQVYNGSAPTPLSVTVVPANAATAVVVSAPITWTFNQAINPAFVNANIFGVYKTAGMAQAAGTLSINAAGLVVTFTPSPSLSAATPYTAKVSMDIGLTADSATTFTTA